MKQFIILAVTVFFIAGCATKGQQARTEGTAGGAAIGAGVGALAGALIGGKKGAAIGAGAGALIGGAAGYSYADRIAKRHKELEGKENDLDAHIEYARGVNQDTEECNQRLENEIGALVAKVNQQQITQQELEKERQALNQKVQVANDQLALAEKELHELKRFQSQQPQTSDELDTEIADLEQNLAQLRKNTSELASLSQRI